MKIAHPNIEDLIISIDVWLWGHGMIKPKIGYIWGDHRKEALKNHGPVFFGHSDMSGISIFEEAQYWGITAAEKALKYLTEVKKG